MTAEHWTFESDKGNWRHHHLISEDYANAAKADAMKAQKLRGLATKAERESRANYHNAAIAEAEALSYVHPKNPRTIAITAVSATNLYWKAGQYDEARDHAKQYLLIEGLQQWAKIALEEIAHNRGEPCSEIIIRK